jgi:hypothetical protein
VLCRRRTAKKDHDRSRDEAVAFSYGQPVLDSSIGAESKPEKSRSRIVREGAETISGKFQAWSAKKP